MRKVVLIIAIMLFSGLHVSPEAFAMRVAAAGTATEASAPGGGTGLLAGSGAVVIEHKCCHDLASSLPARGHCSADCAFLIPLTARIGGTLAAAIESRPRPILRPRPARALLRPPISG